MRDHREVGADAAARAEGGPWVAIDLPPEGGAGAARRIVLGSEIDACAWFERLGQTIVTNRRENARLRIDLGVALLAARQRVRHGTWDWFLERCRLDPRLARKCMQVVDRMCGQGLALDGAWVSWRQIEEHVGVMPRRVRHPAGGSRAVLDGAQDDVRAMIGGSRAVLKDGPSEVRDMAGGSRAVLTTDRDETADALMGASGSGRPALSTQHSALSTALPGRPLTSRREAVGQMTLAEVYEAARDGLAWLRRRIEANEMSLAEAQEVARLVQRMRGDAAGAGGAGTTGNSSSATDGASLTDADEGDG